MEVLKRAVALNVVVKLIKFACGFRIYSANFEDAFVWFRREAGKTKANDLRGVVQKASRRIS